MRKPLSVRTAVFCVCVKMQSRDNNSFILVVRMVRFGAAGGASRLPYGNRIVYGTFAVMSEIK